MPSKRFKKGKFAIAMIGVVGSGKTHVAKFITKKYGIGHINTDKIRVELRNKKKSEWGAAQMAARQVEKILKTGKPVILDFDHINPSQRRKLRDKLRKFGYKAFFVKVKTPKKVIFSRLKNKRYAKDDYFQSADHAIRVYHLRNKWHKRKQGFKSYFLIDNGKPLTPQVEKLMNLIDNKLYGQNKLS